MLNKELGGNRRFILCTNNDVGEKKEKEYKKIYGDINDEAETWKQWCEKYGIASSVTYPRIKAAIQGFIHTKDFKEVLFQQKITPAIINNTSKMLSAAEKTIAEYKTAYDSVKTVVEGDVFKVLGIVKKGKNIAGIPANLKYYKTEFVPKDEEFLSDALLEHIVEMIQIEHGVKVDGDHYLLVWDDDDADALETRIDSLTEVKSIYVSKNVLLTTAQIEKFSKHEMVTIPDYYFSFELKETGESW